jgi:prevent-host-death family protein
LVYTVPKNGTNRPVYMVVHPSHRPVIMDGVTRLGVRDLRRELPAAIRRAGAGERIIITVDGTPVAQLGPLEPVDEHLSLEDLAARGQLVLARRSDRPATTFKMPMWAGTRLDQLVREVRGR